MHRHKFDSLSFAFGLVYALVGLLFLIPATPLELAPVLAMSVRWVWPVAILGIGAAVLVPLLRRSPERDHES